MLALQYLKVEANLAMQLQKLEQLFDVHHFAKIDLLLSFAGKKTSIDNLDEIRS